MQPSSNLDRRGFLGAGAAVGVAGLVGAAEPAKVKVGVIGCGSVSHSYLPHLSKCPHVELVSACDIIAERAKAQAEKFKIPNHYPHIDKMLAGAAFDLLVNLTDMQEHERLNRAGGRGRQARLEREADGQLARRRAGAARRGQEEGRPDLGRAGDGGQPAVRVHGQDAGRRQARPAGGGPRRLRPHRARTGPRSSTRRAAAACPTWRSTT